MSRLVLGIESSCDEVAAGVYDSQKGILSNKLFSQTELHTKYGGVVPEIASRSHIEKINLIVEQALQTAHVKLDDIDVVAVTNKPGLAGSLLVGVCFAKAVAWAQQKPIIGINHLEGHIFSIFLEYDVPLPHLCLTSSGGHTALFLVKGFGDYKLLGQTLDDAAGEAFDKVAKLLQLGYPGGPLIEKLAHEMDYQDYFSYPRGKLKNLNFSFSGLKTAVMYDLVKKGLYDIKTKILQKDEEVSKKVASSFLVCIKDIFEEKLSRALAEYPDAKAVTFVGGVACNKYLKKQLAEFCAKRGRKFFTTSPQYCTDNAAMIAFVGNYKAEQGKFSDYYLDILK